MEIQRKKRDKALVLMILMGVILTSVAAYITLTWWF